MKKAIILLSAAVNSISLESVHMSKKFSLDELNAITNKSTKEFVQSLVKLNLEKGSFISGKVYFTDFPPDINTAEIQVVLYDSSLIDMTLTSTNFNPYRWTCSNWTNSAAFRWLPVR
jgi:hypothetical protein